MTRRPRPGVAPAAEVDIDGLRPHREGAPASRIHWPAYARTGELTERRLRAEGDTRPLIILDPRGPDDSMVDAAVRAAASLCVHLAGRGGCALLLPGDRRPSLLEPGLAGWAHLHTRLALVENGATPSLMGLSARRGAVIYVAGRPAGSIPRALLHAPGTRVLVVPGRVPGRVPAFTVAGCHGYELESARRPQPGGGPHERRRRTPVGARAAAAAPDAVLASPAVVRVATAAAVALFGALHWAELLEPAARGRMLLCTLAVVAAAVVAVTIRGRSVGARLAAASVAVVAALLLLPLARVPGRLFAPRSGTRSCPGSRRASRRSPASACPTGASIPGCGSTSCSPAACSC